MQVYFMVNAGREFKGTQAGVHSIDGVCLIQV